MTTFYEEMSGGQGELGVPIDEIGAGGAPIRVVRYTTESVLQCDGETPQSSAVLPTRSAISSAFLTSTGPWRVSRVPVGAVGSLPKGDTDKTGRPRLRYLATARSQSSHSRSIPARSVSKTSRQVLARAFSSGERASSS